MSGIKPLSFPQGAAPAAEQQSSFPFSAATAHATAQSQVIDSATRMKQLEEMLQEVQGRAEIVEKEAYDSAYLAGEKAGMALGKKRAEQILESVQETLQDANASLASIQYAFSDAAMDIARHIAEQIVGNAIEQEPGRLLNIAEQAAAQLPDTTDLKVAVSADDFASFKRLLDESESLAVLTADSSIPSGTCRIVSSQQDILIDPVAAVSAYLDQLQSAMLSNPADQAEKESDDRHDDESSIGN